MDSVINYKLFATHKDMRIRWKKKKKIIVTLSNAVRTKISHGHKTCIFMSRRRIERQCCYRFSRVFCVVLCFPGIFGELLLLRDK